MNWSNRNPLSKWKSASSLHPRLPVGLIRAIDIRNGDHNGLELQVNLRYAGRAFIADFVGAHGCPLDLVRVISFVAFVVAR